MENKLVPKKFLEKASRFRVFVYKFVESKFFGAAILFVILINTVVLIVQTNQSISVKGGWYFSILDNVFLSIYIVELVLKLYALRLAYFNVGWNVMDFVIVISTTIDFLLPLIMQNVASFDVAAIFRLLRMFRAIKALRALRVLRTIRFLKNLQVIMTTILKSFRALSTIVMLQGLFLYMFAVIGRGLFYDVAPSRFGSISRAFFTLFQLITLDDWYYMYTDVISVDQNFGLIIIYLIIYIVLENFIFLNLFVAVLVDNFQRTLTAAEVQKKSKTKTVFSAEKQEAGSFDDEDSSEEYFGQTSSTSLSEVSSTEIHYPVIEDYYAPTVYPNKRERELMGKYFIHLASLEYNMHRMANQHRLLDELVDISVSIPDVPEELI